MRGARICAGLALICCGLVSVASAKTMTLTIWDWHQPRADLIKPKLAEYTKLHPDTKFRLTVATGYADYWVKFLTATVAGDPPDIVQFHNSRVSQFVPKLMAPFPTSLFPLSTMRSEYYGFDQGFVFGGKMYFMPLGIFSGVVFYNKKLWAETGLGGLPTTWDELRDAAKKLTKLAANGKQKQAGFHFTPSPESLQWLWDDFNYQLGGWLFQKDKTGLTLDTAEGQKALKVIAGWALQDHVTALAGDSSDELDAGKSGMQYSWTWYEAFLNQVKDLQYGAFALPTEDGAVKWARGRNNWEVGHGVPAGVSPERKAEAFKFIKWLYSDGAFLTKLNAALGTVPGRTNLWNRPEIVNDPAISVVAKQLPYTIFPGERPEWLETVMGTMSVNVLTKKYSPEVALKRAQDQANIEFKRRPTTWIVERLYKPGK